uniref:Uncharacterized protein n=1 Tax=Cyclopterus lumpus TaxID=8103 RepID=A0A8C2WT45_CYCLU
GDCGGTYGGACDGDCNHTRRSYRDNDGRLLVSDFCFDGMEYRIINVHAPNKETDRKMFLMGLKEWCINNTMIIGDFNVVLSKSDISNNNVYKNDVSRGKLIQLISDTNLIDIWRIINNRKRGFTRRQIVNGKLKQGIKVFVMLPLYLGR